MEHKFKVNDTVFIRECTDHVPEMQKMVGTEATVNVCTEASWDKLYPTYKLKEDNGVWFWREDWLEPVDDITIGTDEFNELFGGI